MKSKKILIGIVIIFLVGCSIKEEDNFKEEMVKDNVIKNYVEPYVDDNPIILGGYLSNGNNKTLVSSYDSNLSLYQDIVSFEIYYTKEESLSGSQKNLWNTYYQTYENIDNYKIGYYLSFQVGEEIISKLILKPSDGDGIFDYIQVYLYDDINQDGGFYDHVTDEEVTVETIFSSIKLTASTKIDEIVGPIKLVIFTYDSENDFDENGMYRGNSSYEININRR